MEQGGIEPPPSKGTSGLQPDRLANSRTAPLFNKKPFPEHL